MVCSFSLFNFLLVLSIMMYIAIACCQGHYIMCMLSYKIPGIPQTVHVTTHVYKVF